LSKSLGPKLAELSTYEKEAMAIIEALKKWRHYLSESTLILITDQKSLKYMDEQRLVQGIQNKLLVKLMGYNYKIEYKKGKENKAVDALSIRAQQLQLMSTSQALPLWINDVIASYAQDEKCQALEEKLRINHAAVPNFTINNGILRYKGRIYVGTTSDLRHQLIASFHDSALGGHSRERVTYTKLKALFHWLALKAVVTECIKNCSTCQKNKSENIPYPGLLQPLPILEMAWQHVTMDFIVALLKSEGHDTIMVVVDKLTKYAHFISLSHPFTT
jgi:hypothetical protein